MSSFIFISLLASASQCLAFEQHVLTTDANPAHDVDNGNASNATSSELGANRRLRVCNAFASDKGLDVTLMRTGAALGTLKYKHCLDVDLKLVKGDKLAFQTEEEDAESKNSSALLREVGKFSVSELPADTGPLLLVVRKGQSAGAAKFLSHAFTPQDNGGSTDAAQVAVIDATQSGKNKLKILDADANDSADSEDLPINAALAISPGAYKVTYDDDSNHTVSFDTVANCSYVVLCVGGGDSMFEKDLFVFPGAPSAGAVAAADTEVKGSAVNAKLGVVAFFMTIVLLVA